MSSSNSLDGLIKWLQRKQWAEELMLVNYEHIGQLCEEAGIDWEEAEPMLGEAAVANLWGAAFEDFLTRDNDDGLNIVDDYLKRRGWKETRPNRHYMAALRHSIMSLYEVSGIVPGESILLRDLVRGGEPIRVSERSGSKSLKLWDHIAVRVVEVDSKTQIGGAVLLFRHELSRDLLHELNEGFRQLPSKRKETAAAEGLDADDPVLLEVFSERTFLRAAAPMFTTFWLNDVFEQMSDPQPPVTLNSDGEDLVFVTIQYPFAAGVPIGKVRGALMELEEFRAENRNFWNWLRSADATKERATGLNAARGVALVTMTEDGSTMLGTIELKKRTVSLSVNSAERAKAGQTILEAALGPLVGRPVFEEKPIDEFWKEVAPAPLEPPPDVPSERAHQTIREMMDRHYQQQLDRPNSTLSDMSPRSAIKTQEGREKVAAWLKSAENQAAKASRQASITNYDFTWMWVELGVEDLRR